MSHCPECGGIIGRDCFNPIECAEIGESQRMQAEHESQYAVEAYAGIQSELAAALTEITELREQRDMARIVKGDRCWFLAGWVRHLKNVLKLADEHRDDLGAALKSAAAERDTLRDKLANARGWIMANATKPVHDLLRAIEP